MNNNNNNKHTNRNSSNNGNNNENYNNIRNNSSGLVGSNLNVPPGMGGMSNLNGMGQPGNQLHGNMSKMHGNLKNISSNLNSLASNMKHSMSGYANGMPGGMSNIPVGVNNMCSGMSNIPSGMNTLPGGHGNISMIRSSANAPMGNMNSKMNISNSSVNMQTDMNLKNRIQMGSSDIPNASRNMNNLFSKSSNNNNSISNNNSNNNNNLRENIVKNLNYNYNNVNYNSMMKSNIEMNNKLFNGDSVGKPPQDSNNANKNAENFANRFNSNKMVVQTSVNNKLYRNSDGTSMNRFYVNDMKNVESNMIQLNNKMNNVKDSQSGAISQYREKEYLENIYKNRDKYMLGKSEKDNLYISPKQLSSLNSANTPSGNTVSSGTMSGVTGMSSASPHERNLKSLDGPPMYNPMNITPMGAKTNMNKVFTFNQNDKGNFHAEALANAKLNNQAKDANYSHMNKAVNMLFKEQTNYGPYGWQPDGNPPGSAKPFFTAPNALLDARTYNKNVQILKEQKNGNEDKQVRYNNLIEGNNPNSGPNPENATMAPSPFGRISMNNQKMNLKTGDFSNSPIPGGVIPSSNHHANVPTHIDNADAYKFYVNKENLNAKEGPHFANPVNILKDNKGKSTSVKKYTNQSKIMKQTDQAENSTPSVCKMDADLVNKKGNDNDGTVTGATINMNNSRAYEEMKMDNNGVPFDKTGNNSTHFNGDPSKENNIHTIDLTKGAGGSIISSSSPYSTGVYNISSSKNAINGNETDMLGSYNQNAQTEQKVDSENLKKNEQVEEKKRKKKREKKEDKGKDKNIEMAKNEKGGLFPFEQNSKGKKKNLDYNNNLYNITESSEQGVLNSTTQSMLQTTDGCMSSRGLNVTPGTDMIRNMHLDMQMGAPMNGSLNASMKESMNESMSASLNASLNATPNESLNTSMNFPSNVNDQKNLQNKNNFFLANYDPNKNAANVFVDKDKSMPNRMDLLNEDDLGSSKMKKNLSDLYGGEITPLTPEQMESDRKLIALTQLFGDVIDENDNMASSKISDGVMENKPPYSPTPSPFKNNAPPNLELLKNMSLDTLLNNLNIDKDVLEILKEKINNINRNINVTIRSGVHHEGITEPKGERENFDLAKLLTLFDDFINWYENNLIQIKLQLQNVSFCLLLEIFILILTNSSGHISDFKKKYLNKFSAYEPVTKFLSTCVNLSQMFEISLVRFKEKNAKHVVHMTKLGKKSLWQYLTVYGGISLYNLITTKIKIVEVEDQERNFNFFNSFISANFLYNAKLDFPVMWSLPSIYLTKEEIVEDESNKPGCEKEENHYVPNENCDAFYYYKHILKVQKKNRLRVTKNRMPSMLYYCLNNCNDMTCAEISGLDGSFVATAHSNNVIKLWNIKQAQMNKIKEKKKDMEKISNVNINDTMTRRHDYLDEHNATSIDLNYDDENDGICTLYGNVFNVTSLCFGESNKILLSGNVNGDVYLYSTVSNKNYVKYVGGHTPIWSLDTAFLGYFFCSSEDDGNLRIYSTNRTYPFITYTYNCPANVSKYHYNSTLVACGYYDNYVHLYDVRVNSFIKRFKNNYPSNQGVTSLSFSKNGRLLSYAGGYTNNINLIDLAMDKFIDVEDKMAVSAEPCHSDAEYTKTYKPFETNLDTNMPNVTNEGTQNGRVALGTDLNSFEDRILSIDFSYDNNLLVSMSCNNLIDFYNCSKASHEIKHSTEKKKIKLEESKGGRNRPYIKLSKSYGVKHSNLMSAKFTPENVLLLFGINTLI
ncbi:Uncharacterized protein PCOAH_00027270 [Plasmodium coatneyi]|uniref:Uncharacterized protein n=1 Tax=Plasmodium coatneyi TaxID=208452 RepID=A0A1B1DZB5_9APIC|nr:Uncharacterized protein PCOAH_00027270 [Plasmodium coatneyi]ANQ08080.1 Uncharacterized protein PCOAH_00027270 [Plasmodium coatneyi]